MASVAVAALGCYLVSLQVAAERARVAQAEHHLIGDREDIRSLQTELQTRSRLVQLERWNTDVLALTAPKARQYLTGEMQLASLATPAAPAAPIGNADDSGLQVPAAVAQVAYRRIGEAPTTKLVHSVSLDLDAPSARPALRRASLTISTDQVAYLDAGGKPSQP